MDDKKSIKELKKELEELRDKLIGVGLSLRKKDCSLIDIEDDISALEKCKDLLLDEIDQLELDQEALEENILQIEAELADQKEVIYSKEELEEAGQGILGL